MPITPLQFQQMQQRLSPKIRNPVPEDAIEDEGWLHDEIIRWIREQVPMPAYIHARMDRRSTINRGAPDFTIFLHGETILVECKTRTGKRTAEQLAWGLCAELHGFRVWEVRSMEEFLKIVERVPSQQK